MSEFSDLFMEAWNKPSSKPYLFQVGQTARVKKKVIEDGQTPYFWAGAKVKILARYTTCLHKDHFYYVAFGEHVEEFMEYELDLRYRKKSLMPI